MIACICWGSWPTEIAQAVTRHALADSTRIPTPEPYAARCIGLDRCGCVSGYEDMNQQSGSGLFKRWERHWSTQFIGQPRTVLDRDVNAAITILQRGLHTLQT